MFVNTAEASDISRVGIHEQLVEGAGSKEKRALARLAYLITGDEAEAEDCVVAAYALAGRRETPFRDWLVEWAKFATVRSAIQSRLTEIRQCEESYLSPDVLRPPRGRRPVKSDLPAIAGSILALDADMLLAELDPLARAVLVLRGALGASARDCSIRLNVSFEAILAVQRQIKAWFNNLGKKESPVSPRLI